MTNPRKRYGHGRSIWDIVKYACLRPDPDFDYDRYVNKHSVKSVVRPIVRVAEPYHYLRHVEDLRHVDLDRLPSRFVLKAAHGSGMNFMVDRSARLTSPRGEAGGGWRALADQLQGGHAWCRRALFDGLLRHKMKRLCAKWLKRNFGHRRELHYRGVENGVLIEECLGGVDLVSYKFYVIDHEVEFICVHRYGVVKTWDMVDPDWVHLAAALSDVQDEDGWELVPGFVKRPSNLRQLTSVVRELSALLGERLFIRIDLYNIDNEPTFGEYTFTPMSGLTEACWDADWSDHVGSLVNLTCDERDFDDAMQEWHALHPSQAKAS